MGLQRSPHLEHIPLANLVNQHRLINNKDDIHLQVHRVTYTHTHIYLDPITNMLELIYSR